MGILLAIFGIVAAGEVVDLEPVKAGTYDCNEITAAGTNPASIAACYASPYCYFNSSEGDGKCEDDPCLHTLQEGVTNCENKPGVTCVRTVPATNQDCVESTAVAFCRTQITEKTDDIYDYCFWANLRDGGSKCPDSICKRPTGSSAGADKSKCVSAGDTGGCQYLSTKDDCQLNPKCMWRNDGCLSDPCFGDSENKPCATWTNGGATWEGGALAAGDCVLYQPYKSDGTVASYCVYKALNPTPNLCYFLKTNNSDSDTDKGITFPNLTPTCTGSITGCDSNPSGECATKWNSKGAFAGQYCGDATHGAANILRIPSLIVFLLASVFVSIFTL